MVALIPLIEAVRIRVAKGSSFKVGPLELGEDLGKLSYVRPQGETGDVPAKEIQKEKPVLKGTNHWTHEREKIYKRNNNIFLTHVISPSRIAGQKYDIFIYLIRHWPEEWPENFSDVEYAEFYFGPWFSDIFKAYEKNGLIGVSTSVYGQFLCTCRVTFKDGEHVHLHRYIDFEMARAFGDAV